MTEVIANYNINMNEFAANMAVEGFQSAEVDAIMKAVGENKTWNAIGGLNDTDANLQGLRGDTAERNVDKTIPPDVIEMAKFAVEEYNKKAGTHLVFMKVGPYHQEIVQIKITPFVQCPVVQIVILGTHYRLFIRTRDDKGTYRDEAVAFKSKAGTKTLVGYIH